MSEITKRSVAAHESGHALVLSAQIPLPVGVIIHTELADCQIAGFTAHLKSPKKKEEMSSDELVHFMLVALGGQAAEKFLLAQDSVLAGRDDLQWKDFAGPFLQRHGKHGWTEANLWEMQMNLLRLFFHMNRAILESLTEAVLAEHTVVLEEFLRTVPPVSYPEKYFPRPTIIGL